MIKTNSKEIALTKKDRSGLSNLKKTAVRNLPKGKNCDVLPGPGRPKGSKNKSPARIVDKITEIDDQLDLDGKGLLDCARQNPKWFYEKIFVKVLPKIIDVDLGSGSHGEIKFEIIKRFEIPKEDEAA